MRSLCSADAATTPAFPMSANTNKLGDGTFGSVYSVNYEGRTCALKIPRLWTCVSNFANEVLLMERLAGAGGAPEPLGFCPDELAFLMTFCGKYTLKEHLARAANSGGLSLQHVLILALRLTERLQEIHRAGFIHCDLKCNNVTLKLDAEGNLESIHIIDFGLSCRVGDRRPSG
ncbi:casein kinase I-like [Penaeus monodon]|uniref:casein kinase I-like n=1 Tax=Penaeus monodon TaxID=6687 RepID=UPI0018A74185|nr:casein kinase I-like [Penaeus monodon]